VILPSVVETCCAPSTSGSRAVHSGTSGAGETGTYTHASSYTHAHTPAFPSASNSCRDAVRSSPSIRLTTSGWSVLGEGGNTQALYGCQVNEPLGWIGWQGIVPAKAAEMSFRLVEMVTSSLVDVSEVFGRLDPHTIAGLLKSEVPAMASSIGRDLLSALLPASLVDLPAWLVGVVGERLASVNGSVLAELDTLQVRLATLYLLESPRAVHHRLSSPNPAHCLTRVPTRSSVFCPPCRSRFCCAVVRRHCEYHRVAKRARNLAGAANVPLSTMMKNEAFASSLRPTTLGDGGVCG
jgi:hypothetical protein